MEKKTQTTQTGQLVAVLALLGPAPAAALELLPGFTNILSDHKAAAVAARRQAGATGRCGRSPRLRCLCSFQMNPEIIASPSFEYVQKHIADSHPCKVTALKRHPNTKHPTAKRAACSSGRTVSDEIQQLQTTTRSLISPREIQSDESRIPQCSISSYGRAIAEIPHQKPADQKTAGKVQLCLSFHFRTSA